MKQEPTTIPFNPTERREWEKKQDKPLPDRRGGEDDRKDRETKTELERKR